MQKLLGQFGTNNPWLTEVWFLLTGQTVLPTNLGTLINGYSPYASLFYNTEGLPYFSTGMSNTFTQIAKSTGLLNAPAAAAAAVPKPPTIPGQAPAARWRPVWATGPTSDTWRFRPRSPEHRRRHRRCAPPCR